MSASDPRRAGTLLATSSAFLAASFFIPYKAATGYAAADFVVVALLLPAAVFNTIAAAVTSRGRLRLSRADLAVAAAIATVTVTGNISMTEALSRAGAGITSVLVQTQVFFVAILGWLLLRERVTVRFAIGAFIAVGGFAVVRLPGDGAADVSLAGSLWALGAALSFGAMHVVTRKYITRIHVVTVNAVRLWMAVAMLLALPGRAAGVADMPAEAWYLGAAAAALGPFGARLCIMFAVRFITASHAALFGLTTPVFAFVLEMLILGDMPSAVEVAGGALILAGVSLPVLELATRGPTAAAPRRRPQHTPPRRPVTA